MRAEGSWLVALQGHPFRPRHGDRMEPGSFSTEMRRKHDGLFQAFWQHPFVAGLRDATVPRAAVLHYVGQDHQYLTASMRCAGLGAAMSPDREWIRFFCDQTLFLLNDEIHPHRVLCAANGVSYETVAVARLTPSAQAYIDHLMACGHDTLGVLVAALMPCPWTYIWAARQALGENLIAQSNPYAGWWAFYGSPQCAAVLDDFVARADALAAQAGPAELARMDAAFETSCYHEIRFWESAWTQEGWDQLPHRTALPSPSDSAVTHA
jgi:thiaminase/transcriptional activator TenA